MVVRGKSQSASWIFTAFILAMCFLHVEAVPNKQQRSVTKIQADSFASEVLENIIKC